MIECNHNYSYFGGSNDIFADCKMSPVWRFIDFTGFEWSFPAYYGASQSQQGSIAFITN